MYSPIFMQFYNIIPLSKVKEKNSKTIYQKTILLDFENLKLPAPVGYDQYLKQLYGNYMELPPKEKRVSQHEFKIYWREK